MEGAHEDSVWFRTKADRKNGEDIWTASDGQKANHQANYGVEGQCEARAWWVYPSPLGSMRPEMGDPRQNQNKI